MYKLFRFIFEPVFREGMQIKYVLNHSKEKFLTNIILENLKGKYNFIISKKAVIGTDIVFPHPHNIIIGGDTKIGNKCTIYQDVTLGQNRGKYPVLGNNVIVYTGAKIIGDVNIGDNTIIGANAVVTKDVPNNVIVAGIPAVIIKKRDLSDEFY